MFPNTVVDKFTSPKLVSVQEQISPCVGNMSKNLAVDNQPSELFIAAEAQALRNCQIAINGPRRSSGPSNLLTEKSLDKTHENNGTCHISLLDHDFIKNIDFTEETKDKFITDLQSWVKEFPQNSYDRLRREQAAERITKCKNEMDYKLDLSNLYLGSLPPVDWKLLDHIRKLILENNHLQEVPEELALLKKLNELNLSHNNLNQLPEWLPSFKNLIILSADCNFITVIPESLAKSRLLDLSLRHNKIVEVPKWLHCHKTIRECELLGNAIPIRDIPRIFLETSEENKLQFKDINDVPVNSFLHDQQVASNLIDKEHESTSESLNQYLKKWSEGNENKEDTAEAIRLCHYFNGERLILDYAREVPEDAIAKLKQVKIISLGNSKIRHLPAEWQKLQNLTNIYLDSSRIRELPLWLIEMPHLSKVSVYACRLRRPEKCKNGKPAGIPPEIADKFFSNSIDWHQLYASQLARLSDTEEFKNNYRPLTNPRKVNLSDKQASAMQDYVKPSGPYKEINCHLRSKLSDKASSCNYLRQMLAILTGLCRGDKSYSELDKLATSCNSALKRLISEWQTTGTDVELYRATVIPSKEVERIREAYINGTGYCPNQLFSCSGYLDVPEDKYFSRLAQTREQNVFFVIFGSHKLAADTGAVDGIDNDIRERIFPYETAFRIMSIKENGDFLQVAMEATDDLNVALLASIAEISK